ncbi:54S ribosomal protein L17 mitochondrial [Ascosphaera atra]|nr:54S ribosomal protein L17 mitochondrial [Ascosphaera atra]
MMAAERALTTTAGPNVNAFFVGNHPIGHFSYTHRNTFRTRVGLAAGGPVGYKEFFLKGRILAGQVDLSLIDKEATRIEDFRWLTREEIEATVSPMYWKSIKGMLGQR